MTADEAADQERIVGELTWALIDADGMRTVATTAPWERRARALLARYPHIAEGWPTE